MYEGLTWVLMFLLGVYLGHIADILALAWHSEEPVFRGGKFRPFWNSITSGNKWFCIVGRKRGIVSTLYETLVSGGLTVALYSYFGSSWMFLLMLYVMFAFMVAFISDMQWREIPHEINYATLGIAVLLVATGEHSMLFFVTGCIPAAVTFAVAFILYAIKPEAGFGMGGGDLRLILSMGCLLGVTFAMLLLLIGSVAAILINIASLIRDISSKSSSYIPMMTGFAAAYLIMLFGHYLTAVEDDLFPILDLPLLF